MKLPQPSLAGGELSPGLHGRTDIARFQVSVARMQNFIVRPTGGAIKRPGFLFDGKVKDKTKPPRAIPFQYSTEIKYRIEAGEYYFRYWVKAGRGYVLLTDLDDNIIETVTPYGVEHLPYLKFTQSADVLYIAGINKTVRVPPKELRRLTPLSFELIPHAARRGPFRSMNSDEAARMAVTSTTGNTVVSCNREIFTDKMIGSLIYFEEKELRSVKPWTPLERNITLGAQRRSDGKVYRATSIPNLGALPGTPYSVCGNDRPVHEIGRAFDGPQDVRNDGVNGYVVGIEWEYLHGAYGIVEITEYTTAFSVKGVVVERLADSIIGTAPAPVHAPWVFSGDNTTMSFSVAGATSSNPLDYVVTINGSAVQSNPYSPPISGGSGPGGGNNAGPIFGDGSLIQQF